MLFCHKHILTKNDNISMTMNFPQGKLEEVKVVIKNIRKNPRSENEPYVIRVSFADLSEPQYEILGGFYKAGPMSVGETPWAESSGGKQVLFPYSFDSVPQFGGFFKFQIFRRTMHLLFQLFDKPGYIFPRKVFLLFFVHHRCHR